MAFRETPKRVIVDHLCEVCRKACGFGQGFDEHARWFCREHLPADFLPSMRIAPASPAQPPPTSTACTPPVTETPKPPPAPARVEAKPQQKPVKPADPSQGSLF